MGTGCPWRRNHGAELLQEEQQPINADEDKKGNNICLTVFNICNSILGTGIIAIPFSFREAGFGFGVILLTLVALMSGFSLIKLGQTCSYSHADSYQGVAFMAYGRPCFIIVGVLQAANSLIACLTYSIFIGDNISKLMVRFGGFADVDELRVHFWGTRAFIIAIPLMVICIPLSSLRDIGRIAKWSVCSMVAIVVAIVIFGIRVGTMHIPRTPGAYNFVGGNFAEAVGILAFAFMCHDVTFVLYRSLDSPTDDRWARSVTRSIAASGAVIAALGILGYVTFTGHTQGNLFENYCNTDDLINAVRLIYVLPVILSVPSTIYVIREVIEDTLYSARPPPSVPRNIVVSLIVLLVVYGLTMSTECLGIALEIVGVMAAVPLTFILPPLLVIRLETIPLLSKECVPYLFIIVFGVVVAAAGMADIIKDIIQGRAGCLQGQEPSYCLSNTSRT